MGVGKNPEIMEQRFKLYRQSQDCRFRAISGSTVVNSTDGCLPVDDLNCLLIMGWVSKVLNLGKNCHYSKNTS